VTGISLRGGPVEEPGRRLVYRGFMCRRLWRRAPLSIEAPLGRMGRSVHRELTDRWTTLETEQVFLCALSDGKLEGGTFMGDPECYVQRAPAAGISLHRGPAGESERG